MSIAESLAPASRNPTAGRIARRFASLRAEGRGGLAAFVTAGDPGDDASRKILAGLPAAGADLIELGMPFTDPMADGPAIQASSLRALKAGASLEATLAIVSGFRATDRHTPIVLMGYFNPIHAYGVEPFVRDAAAAGADGLIIVDLPPEEAHELKPQATARGMDFIRLATPTSDDERLPIVVGDATGFIYYVSILGVTGTKSATDDQIRKAVDRIRRHTDLPVAVGFGIKTPEAAAAVARVADAAVVGSALVNKVLEHLDSDGKPKAGAVDAVLGLVRDLAAGVRSARR